MRVRIARDERRRLRELTHAIDELESEIAEPVAQVAPQLLHEPGFGSLTAAKLVGEIAGADRFATDAKLARAAGLAPIPVSSGRTDSPVTPTRPSHPAPPPGAPPGARNDAPPIDFLTKEQQHARRRGRAACCSGESRGSIVLARHGDRSVQSMERGSGPSVPARVAAGQGRRR
jgi:hypothetical protein